jgi:hypothetical protein
MRDLGLGSIEEATEYKRIGTGGFTCKITKVEDVTDKEYLKIEYDVADGDFKNYYQELFDSKSFWGGKFIKSYKEKALPFFKGFITSIENSNKGFKFDNDETKLVGKLIGLIVGEEEYNKADGTVGNRLYVDKCTSVDKIKSGEFEVPAAKKLPISAAEKAAWSALSSAGEDELPF